MPIRTEAALVISLRPGGRSEALRQASCSVVQTAFKSAAPLCNSLAEAAFAAAKMAKGEGEGEGEGEAVGKEGLGRDQQAATGRWAQWAVHMKRLLVASGGGT